MKIIAELCQNHNGNPKTLFQMVDEAVEAGASHVKIQHIYSKNLVFRPEFEKGLKDEKGQTLSIMRPWQNEYDRLKKLELSHETNIRFVEYAKSLGVIPMTTCFTRGDVETISQQGFRHIKVASYDCASFQLLKDLSEKFEYLYVSTGATFDDELIHASNILKEKCKNYIFLHCVTQYPTPLESMNLNRINWLNKFSKNVGFSDHSLVERDGIIAAKAAITSGAKVIERHFTILEKEKTKDGPVSISKSDIQELLNFCKLSREDQLEHLFELNPNWKIMMGQANRWLSKNELLNRDYYRGRFASLRKENSQKRSEMIFNWEETPL